MMYSCKNKAKKRIAMLLIAVFFLSGISPALNGMNERASASGTVTGMFENSGFETMASAEHDYGTNDYYWRDYEAKPWSIWAATGTPAYTVVSDVKQSGESSLRITHADSARSSISQAVTGLSAGETYKVGMWIKTENVVEMVLPRVQFINDAGGKVGNIYYGSLSTFTGTNDWSYTETGLTIPVGATGYKIEIFLGANGITTGTAWIDDVIGTSTIPMKGIQVEPDHSVMLPGDSALLDVQLIPSNAANREVIWTSSNTAVAAVENGTVNAVTYGGAIVSAETVDGGFTDSVTILVGDLSGVTVEDETVTMLGDQTLTGLTTAISIDGGELSYSKLTDPANGSLAVASNGSWTYTPNPFYSGEDRFIIVASSTNGGVGISTITVAVGGVHDAELEAIRQDWYNRLLGGNDYNAADPDVNSYIQNIVTTAQERWTSMDRSATRPSLWPDMANPAQSWNIPWAFEQLRNLALAYRLEASSLYGNQDLGADIIDGLDWMYANKYNENQAEYDNWFHWQISGPQALNDLLVLMYDELTQAQIDNYMRAIDAHVQEPGHKGTKDNPGDIQTGANLTDRVMVVALRGVIGKNSVKVAAARDALGPVFPYVNADDGFYEDGSFIQHGYVAYIGGYGGSLLKSLSNVLNLLNGTSFEVTDPNLNHVWDWIPNSYEPFIYKGGMMDMVKGRSAGTEDHATGRAVIISLIRLLDGMPEDEALLAKQMIKEWVLSDTTFDNYYETTEFSITEIIKLKEILNDPSIERRGDLIKSKIFPSMANAVHMRPGFGFAVSMFSNSISAFEYGNNQNPDGWYTGAGMTYLYNNDLSQYTNNGKTIDFYRLPGTTTDGSKGILQGWKKYSNPRKWVGGSTVNELFSSVGMDFSMSENTGSSLEGKKSWFMFGDKMVALGSDITSTNNLNTETIIDNRRLNKGGTNVLTIDGVTYGDGQDWTDTFTNVDWAHLQGNVPGADVGYYFPTSTDVYGVRETKEGTSKVFPVADAFVGNGNKAGNNYGKNTGADVRSNGTSYHYESYFKFDLSQVEGNITSAKLRLYPFGAYGGTTGNSAEVVSNDWTEEGLTWNNRPADSGELIDSWKPVRGVWVNIDITDGAKAAQLKAEDQHVSVHVYPDASNDPTNDTVNYATREHTTTSWRPYLEIVTDKTTDTYQSLAFEHGTNPADETYAYAVLPNKTAEEVASYASNPDISILSNTTDVHAVKDHSINAVGANFWSDGPSTVEVDGVAYLTSDKAASVTTIEHDDGIDIAVSDPTKENTGVINIEVKKPDYLIEAAELDPRITVMQLSPTIRLAIDVNGANGKSLQAKFVAKAENPSVPVWPSNPNPPVKPEEPTKPEEPSEDPDTVTTPGKPPVVLTDITNHWAAKQIEKAIEKKIVQGYPDGTFKPDVVASRAQFIVMLMNAIVLENDGAELSFADSGQIGSWAHDAIAKAVQAGIINGYKDGSFRPNGAITRAEMVVMIGRTLGLSPEAADVTSFKDDDDIPRWAKGMVAMANELGIVNGRGNNQFKPNEQATRAEAVTILLKILELQERSDI